MPPPEGNPSTGRRPVGGHCAFPTLASTVQTTAQTNIPFPPDHDEDDNPVNLEPTRESVANEVDRRLPGMSCAPITVNRPLTVPILRAGT